MAGWRRLWTYDAWRQLCLRGRKDDASLRPRVKRYAGASVHHNSTRDRQPIIFLVRIVCTHVQLQLNSTSQTSLERNAVSARRFDVHHDVQRCLPKQ